MSKRMIPLLLAVMLLMSVAPAAFANHCARCKISMGIEFCIFNAFFGREDCDDSSGSCILIGDPCTHPFAAVTPLSSDYVVASVERIDETPAPDQALVARLDAPKPASASTR